MITVNIDYTGKNGSTCVFAEEITFPGLLTRFEKKKVEGYLKESE